VAEDVASVASLHRRRPFSKSEHRKLTNCAWLSGRVKGSLSPLESQMGVNGCNGLILIWLGYKWICLVIRLTNVGTSTSTPG